MALTIGSRLGVYEVTSSLGAGGMGEVYGATDTRLHRRVALKVLPDALAADPERLARFEREAQILAQLHHPNIASVFGLEESQAVRALVMELVEGPTLADRLAGGRIPLDEALSIAIQIAEALEEAHEKGIIHRDLKPQNIKSSPGEPVKVLDFGLAKAMDSSASGRGSDPLHPPALSVSPTITSVQGTKLGVILGTAAYMAPEQARGGTVDRRADIWAFGVVLWEMLSGKSLFAGDTISDTLAGVLKSEVDFGALPADTPPQVRQLLVRCLERNPKNRLRDIGDARLILDETLRGASSGSGVSAAPGPATARGRSAALPWVVAALALVLAAALGARALSGRSAPVPAQARTEVGVLVPPDRYLPRSESPPLDLSADGRTLIFVTEGRDRPAIFRRSFDRMMVDRIPGTDGADQPILSPDGRWIAFFSSGSLRKIPVEGGSAVAVAEARTPRGACWMPDGSLVYSPLYSTGLWRVDTTGGAPVEITKLDLEKQERTHRWPNALPDGKTVLFTVGLTSSPGSYDDARIDAVRLDTGERRTLLEGARMARYSAAGYLIYQRQQALLAARFDPSTLTMLSAPFTIQEGVGGDSSSGSGYFAVAANGLIATAPESAIPNERLLTLVDRQGHETQIAAPPAAYTRPQFSPDGKTIVFAIGTGSAADDDLYLHELATQRTSRLTFGQGHGIPCWTPDGRGIIYVKGRSGEIGLAWKAADGSGSERFLLPRGGISPPEAWLPGGRTLLITDLSGSLDIAAVDLDSARATPVFANPAAAEYGPSTSPDGRFVAYTSAEGGQDDVYVETYPPGGGKWQISEGVGVLPRWSRDGREIYFVSGDWMMAVDVSVSPVFRSGVPRRLFAGPYDIRTPPIRNYDVGPDGRFVVVKRALVSTVPRELVLIDGWESADRSATANR